MEKAEQLNLKGFFRVKLGEEKDGKTNIVGDSGWLENQVTNLGFQNYVCNLIGSLAGSKQVGMIIIGTGTVPNVTHTALDGEVKRQTCGNAVVASKTMRATAQIASGAHPGGTPDIANIGLIENTASGGTLFCGNTFASSTWNSNQGLSATYELRFGTSS
jgi:hypothetical protein